MLKMLLYCPKAKPELYNTDKGLVLTDFGIGEYYKNKCLLNGKIVGECDFEVEKIYFQDGTLDQAELGITGWRTSKLIESNLLLKSCLSYNQLVDYLENNDGYAIHIKNIVIYDEPRELSYANLDKAPKNIEYCFTIDNEFQLPDICCVSPVSPKEIWNIAKELQTTIVRKRVLKEML